MSPSLDWGSALRGEVLRAPVAPGEDETFDTLRECIDLRSAQGLKERRYIVADLFPQTLLNFAPPRLEPDIDAASVVRRNLAANEAAALQAFEQCGYGGPRHVEAIGQFSVAQTLLILQVAKESQLRHRQVLPVPDAQADLVEECAGLEERRHGLFKLCGPVVHSGSLPAASVKIAHCPHQTGATQRLAWP